MCIDGRERCSCQASGPSAMLGVMDECRCCLRVGRALRFPQEGGAGRNVDGLSGYKAAEMSSRTLLLRGRLSRWRSHSRLSIAPCGVDAHRRCTQSHEEIVTTATLKGWPLLFQSVFPCPFTANLRQDAASSPRRGFPDPLWTRHSSLPTHRGVRDPPSAMLHAWCSSPSPRHPS